MDSKSRKLFIKILVFLVVCIIGVFIGTMLYLESFNKKEHTISDTERDDDVYFEILSRNGNTSSWEKRDFDLYGENVTLLAQIFDGDFYNNSSTQITEWNMTIHVLNDCFLNQTWNGTAEIHQAVGTEKEKVQTFNNQNYKLEDLEVDYLHDGENLYIPLYKGDYIVFYPDGDMTSLKIDPKSKSNMGMIWYFLESMDTSGYSVNFYYHKTFIQCAGFYVLVVLLALFVILGSGLVMSELFYRNAEKELRLRQSGVASMSDLYSIIYYIDLEKDTLTPIHADEESEKQRPKDKGAREQLLYMTASDAEEQYLKITQEFIDIATVSERLDKGCIACEYISKSHGWTLIRFFPADRVEGEPVNKVIFAIQDINEEKIALKKYEELVEKGKYANAYVVGLSGRTGSWLSQIRSLNDEILNKTKEEGTRSLARQIKSVGSLLAFTIDSGNDAAMLSAGSGEKIEKEYRVEDVLSEFFSIAETMLEHKPIEIVKDISDNIPRKLKGDVSRIERVLIQLLSDAVHYTEKGSLRFALYGKVQDRKVHLLFSVKDSGGGISEKRLQELYNYIERLSNYGPMGTVSNGRGLEVAACILSHLGSKLNVISSPGVGTEFYFEIDQEVVDSTPIDNGNL